MTPSIFDAFHARGVAVQQYLAGSMLLSQPQMMNGHFQQGMQPLNLNDIQPLHDTAGIGMDLFGGGGMESLAPGVGGGDMRMPLAGGNSMRSSRRERNPSIVSFGNLGNLRMSLTGRMSEVSYGRAMSGLSALSIDWENMDDFDINVDHSAHINNTNSNGMGIAAAAAVATGAMGSFDMDPKGVSGSGGRRSSMRQPLMGGTSGTENDAHVSFKL
jgi:hypothetical protein